jgi:hypothetical protein
MNNVTRKAKDLRVGDVFRLHVYGIVTAAFSAANGKRVKIKIELEDQERANRGVFTSSESEHSLEFTDAGYILEFLCSPSRIFHVYADDDDDDWRDGDDEPLAPPRLSLLARSVEE